MVVEIFSLEHGRDKNNFVPKGKNNSRLVDVEIFAIIKIIKRYVKKKNKNILFSN